MSRMSASVKRFGKLDFSALDALERFSNIETLYAVLLYGLQ